MTAGARVISGTTTFGASYTGAEITGVDGISRCTGIGGRNCRGRGACIRFCARGAFAIGAMTVTCGWAEKLETASENWSVNRRAKTSRCAATLVASDRGDCGMLPVGVLNSNNGTLF